MHALRSMSEEGDPVFDSVSPDDSSVESSEVAARHVVRRRKRKLNFEQAVMLRLGCDEDPSALRHVTDGRRAKVIRGSKPNVNRVPVSVRVAHVRGILVRQAEEIAALPSGPLECEPVPSIYTMLAPRIAADPVKYGHCLTQWPIREVDLAARRIGMVTEASSLVVAGTRTRWWPDSLVIACDEYGTMPLIRHDHVMDSARLARLRVQVPESPIYTAILLGMTTIQAVFCEPHGDYLRARSRRLVNTMYSVPFQVAVRAQRLFLRLVLFCGVDAGPWTTHMLACACASLVARDWGDDEWVDLPADLFVDVDGVSAADVIETTPGVQADDLDAFLCGSRSYARHVQVRQHIGPAQLVPRSKDITRYFMVMYNDFYRVRGSVDRVLARVHAAALNLRTVVLQLFGYDNGCLSDPVARLAEADGADSTSNMMCIYSRLYWPIREDSLGTAAEELRLHLKSPSLETALYQRLLLYCSTATDLFRAASTGARTPPAPSRASAMLQQVNRGRENGMRRIPRILSQPRLPLHTPVVRVPAAESRVFVFGDSRVVGGRTLQPVGNKCSSSTAAAAEAAESSQ